MWISVLSQWVPVIPTKFRRPRIGEQVLGVVVVRAGAHYCCYYWFHCERHRLPSSLLAGAVHHCLIVAVKYDSLEEEKKFGCTADQAQDQTQRNKSGKETIESFSEDQVVW